MRVATSALAHELTLLRAEILARMAAELGPDVVLELRTRVGAVGPKAYDPTAPAIPHSGRRLSRGARYLLQVSVPTGIQSFPIFISPDQISSLSPFLV